MEFRDRSEFTVKITENRTPKIQTKSYHIRTLVITNATMMMSLSTHAQFHAVRTQTASRGPAPRRMVTPIRAIGGDPQKVGKTISVLFAR